MNSNNQDPLFYDLTESFKRDRRTAFYLLVGAILFIPTALHVLGVQIESFYQNVSAILMASTSMGVIIIIIWNMIGKLTEKPGIKVGQNLVIFLNAPLILDREAIKRIELSGDGEVVIEARLFGFFPWAVKICQHHLKEDLLIFIKELKSWCARC